MEQKSVTKLMLTESSDNNTFDDFGQQKLRRENTDGW